MNTLVITTRFTARVTRLLTLTLLLMFMAAALSLLSACGGDDPTAPPVVNQNPSGLYKSVTSTSTLGGTAVSDMRGFVHNNRLIAFSVTAHYLIDGTINTISGNNYTATVSVYKNGLLAQAGVAVTGLVTNASSISGTLSGTGVSSASFNLAFDSQYETNATVERISQSATDWLGTAYSEFNTAGPELVLPAGITVQSGLTMGGGALLAGSLDGPECFFDNGVLTIPDTQVNVYTITHIVTQGNGCTLSTVGNYTGFATVITGTGSSNVDDTLLYAASNGTHAIFTVFVR